ncbi:LapA family protein [Pelagibius litoralis]|uniref:LapA family protein n=1 Tax=Pelagibius litoralis TaxID=374515 RepID=A0A967C1T3_9PROT|nr:LapA family protein [Pelagibius litoralis]NIA67981.1 LapA family protein [Pelagibius litoralis]
MRYIFWILTLPLTAVFIIFTVANRAPVVIDFWPFELKQSLPFSLVVLLSLLFGFLVGAFLMWLRFGMARARARHAEQRAAVLERELESLKRSHATARPHTTAGHNPPPALSAPTSADQTPRLPAASGGR